MARNNLRAILIDEGVTQAELSRKSNLSAGTINKVCNQKRSPSPTTVSKIVKSLNNLAGKKYDNDDVFPKMG